MFMQYMTDHLDLHMIQSIIIYVQNIVKLFKHAKTYEYLTGVQSPKLTEYESIARVSWNTIPCHKKQTNHATSEVFCIILVHVEAHLLILHIAVVLAFWVPHLSAVQRRLWTFGACWPQSSWKGQWFSTNLRGGGWAMDIWWITGGI